MFLSSTLLPGSKSGFWVVKSRMMMGSCPLQFAPHPAPGPAPEDGPVLNPPPTPEPEPPLPAPWELVPPPPALQAVSSRMDGTTNHATWCRATSLMGSSHRRGGGSASGGAPALVEVG